VGVFWDVDGTLADSSGLGWRATNAVLAANSLQPVTMEEYHEGTRFTTPERFSWHVSRTTGDPLGLTLGSQFDAMYVDMVTEATTALYPGVRELLDTVVRRAGVEVVFAALSNACGAYVRRVLEVQGLAERFQLQLGADQVARAKPHPDGLEHLARELDIPPHHCVYIGDSPTDGMAGAGAGMEVLGVAWGSHPTSSLATAFPTVLDTPEQLCDAILGLIDNMKI